MEDSILLSIREMLVGSKDDDSFDQDLLMYINLAFSTLIQVGVDIVPSFRVEDDSAIWDDFIGEREDLEGVKTYVQIKTKLLFDPPQSSVVIECLNKQIAELEFRLPEIVRSSAEEENQNGE